jgi:hypothetical protein
MRWKSDSSGKLHTNADCLSRFPLTSSDTNDEEICVTIGVQNSVNNELFTSEDLDELTAKQKNNHLYNTDFCFAKKKKTIQLARFRKRLGVLR